MPEGVWVRTEKQLENNLFEGILLNEPYKDFGVSSGDIVKFIHIDEPKRDYRLIAVL